MSGSPDGFYLPSLAAVSDEFLATGHVWVHEYVDGTPFGLRLGADGRLLFAFTDPSRGQASRQWVHAERVQPEYGFAVRYIHQHFDRSAFQAALADPESVTIWCLAVHRRHRGYDWDLAPSVVGVDIEYPSSTFLPHELEQVFEALGLATLPTIDTEVHVRDIGVDGKETPETQWGEGTAYGVLYRKKGGGIAREIASEYTGEPPHIAPIESSVDEYAATVAADSVLTSIVEEGGSSLSVSMVTDAVLDQALRDDFGRLTHNGTSFDIGELRSTLAQRVAMVLK
ncbi:hypothetical protein [Halobaculum limi]|uniref:hypothetical protein n=1 Tax=Halobaculum limi TaxID=3031916 RepID=UPI0024069161|nr:hypothetical protein [Halobaculum sp. YSMS11]